MRPWIFNTRLLKNGAEIVREKVSPQKEERSKKENYI
jgi:hypothetical protein